MTIEKAKDGIEGVLGSFTLKTIDVGTDLDNDPVRSCVIVPLAGGSHKPRRPHSGTAAGDALNELEQLVINHTGERSRGHARAPDGVRIVSKSAWRDACHRKQLSDGTTKNERHAFNRAIRALYSESLVATHGEDGPWLISPAGRDSKQAKLK